MNIRVRFTKEGEMKYIGHLDMMRYFQKAIRRAHIDVAYSEGFNPHQIISFASPLSLGMTSSGEYFDVRVNSSESSNIMISKLNDVMAEGVKVLSWKKLPDEGRNNAMASLSACSYEINFANSSILNRWEDFISQEKIIVHKKTKKNEVDIDIKPLILDFNLSGDSLYVLLRAGSEKSIKVISVLDEYFKFINCDTTATNEFLLGNILIKRIDQFTGCDNLISLDEVGEKI